ncbi:TRAP transporter large permease [Limimaricola soesokkakensis]|uniref:TRAP transporter large permease n=1 Tax=Limimaricola soesokkakensis TaxID=1343159 RepID=UPI003512549B
MSASVVGLIGLLGLFVLLGLRVPVAVAMFAVGGLGSAYMLGTQGAVSIFAGEAYTLANSPDLIVVPLFILMGNLATQTGLSKRLYDAAYSWIGAFRGGLASATVIGCAGFSCLSGSSVATALTMGRVSLGEMQRFGYDRKLSVGAVASGGTLGIMIPPSTGFVLYAILTQQSIGRLFLTGILPGLLLCALFIAAIVVIATIWPGAGPAGPATSLADKSRALISALPFFLIVCNTIGGIYAGIFSPVEAASMGATLVLLYGIATRTLGLRALVAAMRDTVYTTAGVMLVLISAHIFNPFLALTRLPALTGSFLSSLEIGSLGVLCLILLTELVLGCFLDGFAMIVLTVPVFYPIVVSLGYDPIWFGVILMLVLEMSLITPPVGLNIFIVRSAAGDMALTDVYRGMTPFVVAMLAAVALLIAFPAIATILPNTMVR